MPGRYVFPGGRVDRADRQIAVEHDIGASDLKKLMVGMKGTPSQARARRWRWRPCARPSRRRAADRQPARGAGAKRRRPGRPSSPPASARRWPQLTFFARAITPPGRPRRYDRRFFCAPAEAIVHGVGVADGELSDLEWHSIAQARSLELPNITRVVLEDLGERIAAGRLAQGSPVPFYHRRNGSYLGAT